jgi:hypothetical protein
LTFFRLKEFASVQIIDPFPNNLPTHRRLTVEERILAGDAPRNSQRLCDLRPEQPQVQTRATDGISVRHQSPEWSGDFACGMGAAFVGSVALSLTN